MTIRARCRIATTLLALASSAWLAPAAGAHESGSRAHPAVSAAAGSHECPHCPARDCSTADHCAAGAPVALASVPTVLVVGTPAVRPPLWVGGRPRSVNPTPPIPPPQPVL